MMRLFGFIGIMVTAPIKFLNFLAVKLSETTFPQTIITCGVSLFTIYVSYCLSWPIESFGSLLLSVLLTLLAITIITNLLLNLYEKFIMFVYNATQRFSIMYDDSLCKFKGEDNGPLKEFYENTPYWAKADARNNYNNYKNYNSNYKQKTRTMDIEDFIKKDIKNPDRKIIVGE